MVRKYTPLLVFLLLSSAKFLIIAVTGQKVTRHPEYIDCSLPDSEDIVVLKGNGTIQRCENGRLEIKFCYAGRNEKADMECVEHDTVLKTMQELPDWQKYFIDRLYVKDSGKKLVDCQKVWDEHPKQLALSANKTHCLASLGEVVDSPHLFFHDEVCFTARHRIMYIGEGNDVKFCQTHNLEIRKCMIIVDGRYQCISIESLVPIIGVDVFYDGFCSRFADQPSHYVPEYLNYLEDCSKDIPDPTYSLQGPKTDSPQFIDCSVTDIGQDFGEIVVIRDQNSWYECSNGQLKLTKCITSTDEYAYRCISQESFRRYERARLFGAQTRKYYVNKNPENDVYCSLVVAYLKTRNSKPVYDECSSSPAIATREYKDYTSELCIVYKQVYSIVGHSFYECEGRHLKLTKCMIYTDGEYFCVLKEDAKAILDFQSCTDDEVCNEFADKYETLKVEKVINTKVCNAAFNVRRHGEPIIQASSPRVRYRPTQIPNTTEATAATIPTTLNSRTCSLAPDDSANRLDGDFLTPGKCINMEEFVRKFDNMTSAQLASKIDHVKLGRTAVDLMTVPDMTIGELWHAGQMALKMLFNKPATEAVIKLIQMFKTGSTDCDVLRNHMIVHRSELCDLIKDCDESNPTPSPLFCQQ